MDKGFECCTVSCCVDKFSFILVGLYRTPGSLYDSIFLNKLDTALNILTRTYENLVLVGDININVLNVSVTHRRLINILRQYNMQYLVNFPTRVTIQCQSAIDNIITNLPNSSLKVEGIITELSDHDAQELKIKVATQDKKTRPNKNLTKTCRKFTKNNIANLKKMLSGETWLNVYNATVETKFTVFHNILLYYFDLCFPLVKSRVNVERKTWIKSDLKKEKK